MSSLFYYTGAVIWFSLAVLATWILYRIMRHAVEAAVFAERLRPLLTKPKSRFTIWWEMFLRPSDEAFVQEKGSVYWPGHARNPDKWGRTLTFTQKSKE